MSPVDGFTGREVLKMNTTILTSLTLFPLLEKEMKTINLKIETILSYQNHIYMVV